MRSRNLPGCEGSVERMQAEPWRNGMCNRLLRPLRPLDQPRQEQPMKHLPCCGQRHHDHGLRQPWMVQNKSEQRSSGERPVHLLAHGRGGELAEGSSLEAETLPPCCGRHQEQAPCQRQHNIGAAPMAAPAGQRRADSGG